MPTLILYYSKKDPSIDQVVNSFEEITRSFDLALVNICIDEDHLLSEKFGGRTPVLQIGPYTMPSPFEKRDVEVMIQSAISRDLNLKAMQDDTYLERVKKGQQVTRSDRFGLWFARNYIKVIIIFLTIFIGVPFLAPIAEKNENDGLARVIYTIYRPLCHQLAFRSYFLFGEQPYYPRALAHVPNMKTYEEVTASNVVDVEAARNFIGNPVLGYKVAICERDIAIYLGIILFGIIFEVSKHGIKGLSWYFWFIFALLPIAIDGFSQLPNLAANPPTWLPIRESTPFLRTITGALFGIGTGWYLFPIMEETMQETSSSLLRKLKIAEQIETLRK